MKNLGTNIWQSLVGRDGVLSWEFVGIAVPGVFWSTSLALVTFDFLDGNIQIAETLFCLGSLLLLVKIGHYAARFRGSIVSRTSFALVFGGLLFGFTLMFVHILQAKRFKENLSVDFKTNIANLGNKMDYSMFWFMYNSGYGVTISPVALISFVKVTSQYSRPVTVTSYTMSIHTFDCGWTYLTPIDDREGLLLTGVSGLADAAAANLEELGVVGASRKPLEPFVSRDMVMLFATKDKCAIQNGRPIQLRLDMTDSKGGTHTYTSPDMMVSQSTPGLPNSTADTTASIIPMSGSIFDITNAYRRLYTDPIPALIDPKVHGSVRRISLRPPISFSFPRGSYTTESDGSASKTIEREVTPAEARHKHSATR